ncbi:MAG: transposase, partial [Deltaproteobacteria bacterium]|nr:transposase [Deltaproteobacteria bacterium]
MPEQTGEDGVKGLSLIVHSTLTPANVHDSAALPEALETIREKKFPTVTILADGAYGGQRLFELAEGEYTLGLHA